MREISSSSGSGSVREGGSWRDRDRERDSGSNGDNVVSVSWVKELEDRQRVALKSAKREKIISSTRESLKDVDSAYGLTGGESDTYSIDDLYSSSSYLLNQNNDSESDRDRDSNSDSGSGRYREGREEISDLMGVRSSVEVVGTNESDLDFISQYEKVVGDKNDCDGQEEGEGGAIDRALKLLGLDGGRRTSQSQPQSVSQSLPQSPSQTQTQIQTQTQSNSQPQR